MWTNRDALWAATSAPDPSDLASTRRDWLQRSACGFGYLALSGLATIDARGGNRQPTHHLPTARRVIFLFLHGGVSHVDSFDPKPKLTQYDGKPFPFQKPEVTFAATGNLLKSPWQFRQYGESGLPVSSLFPNIGRCMDDICVVRSMQSDFVSHGGAALQLHTGDGNLTRPRLGSWLMYGLGTENNTLPGFINISPSYYHGGAQNYGAAFLPARYQGMRIGDGNTRFEGGSIDNLAQAGSDRNQQRRQLDLLRRWNQRYAQRRGDDLRLTARIEAFELAFRMQRHIPQVIDISGESQETLDLYGIGTEPTDEYGRECLLARRLAERGVRFIQASLSYPLNYWDQHGGLKRGHQDNARKVDQPIAGLLKDLKRRGMLQDTLLVFGTEFGRSPAVQGKDGRDHNPTGITMWFSGGGIRGGTSYGATDEFGYFAVDDIVTINDFHAIILHLMGLDHRRLTYRHAGRDFRLTDVGGRVPSAILA